MSAQDDVLTDSNATRDGLTDLAGSDDNDHFHNFVSFRPVLMMRLDPALP
jgi:hypothetical protein